MIESAYHFSPAGAELAMEKTIDDERVNINHIVVPPGKAAPTHASNSYVHQIIVRGTLSLSRGTQCATDFRSETLDGSALNR